MRNCIFFILLVVCSFATRAQNSTTFNFSFNHLALSVKDLDRSAGFYANVLQLTEIANRTKMEGIRWFALSDARELHLISILKEPVIINKAVHLALTTADFDRFVKSLDELKIAYSDWPGTAHKINLRADGIKQVFFQDPDGYWIEVNSVAAQ